MTSSMFDLAGRVALVTGGNGGIGLGIAGGLLRAGAAVMITGRNAAKAETALVELRRSGRAEFIAADIGDEAACRDLVPRTVASLGRLDIVVNNAGTTFRKPPEQISMQEWHTVIGTNLTSAFVLSQAAYPEMKKSGHGKIINIGSMLSIFGMGVAAPYGASKGGIVQLTRSLAVAWAKDNIQVNALLPGWIDTDLTRHGRQQIAGLHERVLARTPAGRWGDPADFAGVAVFLASPASDFVTGTAIPIDGGFSVQG
ncbi:MAG: SDR family NAD(P)-dependent oxidoreductase [Pseudolabrys sp.]